MKRALVMVTAVCLAGCGVSEDKFKEEYFNEYCRVDATCDAPSYASESECVTAMEAFDALLSLAGSCEYDKKLAADCLTAWEDATCDDNNVVGDPSECADVYVCDLDDTDDTDA